MSGHQTAVVVFIDIEEDDAADADDAQRRAEALVAAALRGPGAKLGFAPTRLAMPPGANRPDLRGRAVEVTSLGGAFQRGLVEAVVTGAAWRFLPT